MNLTLSAEAFASYFAEIHGHPPFPWQRRLAAQVFESGRWPDVLELPTGFGKTAALDVAVFHLALEADRGLGRRAAVRIVFAVDRRLVVDDAFSRAQRIARALSADSPPGPVARLVAQRLRRLSGPRAPLIVRRLRGGIPREDDWAHTPAQPTILCSTVDQVGSRLLFRGYGISEGAKPIQAGLIGSDCLILLDEAHLSEPFRQTLAWVDRYRGPDWRESSPTGPWGVTLLTATPADPAEQRFGAGPDDRSDPVLSARWLAPKPARLVLLASNRSAEATDIVEDEPNVMPVGDSIDERGRVAAIVAEVRRAVVALRRGGIDTPAVGVVVNRVFRARAVYHALQADSAIDAGTPLLLVGPARPADRQELTDQLEPVRTRVLPSGGRRELACPVLVVATQCIEAGVDVDLDGLITDLAPLDVLRQRFGRLNRAGRNIVPYAAVIADQSDLSAQTDDPIYGPALRATWDYLSAVASKPAQRGEPPSVDFGLAAFHTLMGQKPVPAAVLAPRTKAPVLLPAHLDLLSQTAPAPATDPEVALYLHGPGRQPASISVIWRADVDPNMSSDDMRRLLTLVPPRAGEAIELPVWAVRKWLKERGGLEVLADVAEEFPDELAEGSRPFASARKVFRWVGNQDASNWIIPEDLRPGDTIVVPADYGGVDTFGWNPGSHSPAADVATKAAVPYRANYFAVRVAPGLIGKAGVDLGEALATVATRTWREAQDALLQLDLPPEIAADLTALDRAKGRGRRVVMDLEAYGMDPAGRPRGVVFVALIGLGSEPTGDDIQPAATEDDAGGSWTGVPVPLDAHCQRVGEKAEAFARLVGLPEARVRDLRLAGQLHDIGKRDPRFQAVLAFGDPLGPDLEHPLAKSAQFAPRGTSVRMGLPPHWRHEAVSVRMAVDDPRLRATEDPDLVLWLIGTHHGWGRPFFPDCAETEPEHSGTPSDSPASGSDPRSLAFDWRGMSWADLYAQLKVRYGTWELARLEAILRLADHEVSEFERRLAEVGTA